MAATPPQFESVADRLRDKDAADPWRQALEDEQRRNGDRWAAKLHGQLRRLYVDGGYLKGVLVLVNIETGQCAAALEVEHGGEVHTLSLSETRLRKWGPYQRIRASEAASLLAAGKVQVDDVPWHGFQICLRDGTYPEWLFTPTDEPESDWKPVAAEFRRRATFGRVSLLSGYPWRLLLAAVVGIAIGVTLYLGLRHFIGIELLRALGYGNF